jgi:hypothetical protein
MAGIEIHPNALGAEAEAELELVGQLRAMRGVSTSAGPGRPGRVLLGWLDPDAPQAISGRLDLPDQLVADRIRIERARSVVAERPPGVDQTNLIQAAPPELQAHIQALRSSPAAAPYWAEGWQVGIADLGRVCAFQPIIHIDEALTRTGVALELAAIAEVALPVASHTETINVSFDESQRAWVVMSRNPNLRFTGSFSAPTNGMPGLGFQYGLLPSFIQVAEYNGRYYLRDGYHRAFGFLARGQRRVPVFWRRLSTMEQMGMPKGMLPHDAVFGERPPTLLDYQDDAVSGSCIRPSQVKLLVINALETTSPLI